MRYLELTKAYHGFFSEVCLSFQEGNVPSETVNQQGQKVPVQMPYLTYQVVDTDNSDSTSMQVNIWTRSSSYKELSTLVDKLESKIGEGALINFSEGRGGIILHKGLPFAQNINDPEDLKVKRALINLEVQIYY
jgi:hypothetical protein